ncbi:hypothetical protein AO738_04080 [Pseudomonas citronellolis]|nr:hypothetical protein AO742_18500 [Pseudomonas citronellolis]KRW77716.1 hypothetical protein AO738_04080 [Pseudomonas citronellolis]
MNSVLEQAPALAKALADGLGVTVGELRKLGSDGKLSSENLIQALQKQGDAVDQSFGKLQTSGGQALTVLGNSFTRLVGQLNDASGAGTIFGDTILSISRYIDSGAITDGLVESFNIWSQTFSAASEDLAGLGADFDALEGAGSDTASFLADAFKEMPVNLRAAVQVATIEISSLFDKAVAYARYAGKAVKAAFTDATEAQAASELEQTLIRINSVREDSLTDVMGERDAILQSAQAARLKAEEERKARDAARAARQKEIEDLRKNLQNRTINLNGAGDAEKAAKEAEKAAKRLQDQYNSVEQNLARQIALYGQTTEVSKVRYETEYGELSKLSEQQKDRLLGLAKELDAKADLVEQDKLRLQILRETGQVRAADELQFELDYAEKMAQYEKDGNTAALARLKTLKAIQDANREADIKPGTVEGVSKAPHTSGLDADVGGASSELIKLDEETKALQDWRDSELKKQLEYLDAKAINEEEYAKRVANIHQQAADEQSAIEAAKNSALLAGGESLFGNLAGLTKEFAGEQSGLYKAMFAIQKAFSIAQTIVNTETAATAAMAPPPVGLGPVIGAPYSQVIRAMGYTSAALIGATAIAGMAHDGIDNIPKEGTWLLDRGERVVDRRTNSDLKDFLNRQGNTSTTTNSKVNNISLNVYGITDAKGMQESTARLARRVSSAVSKSDRYA